MGRRIHRSGCLFAYRMTVKLGIIGLGYWGPNLVRNFAQAAGGQLIAVSDLDEGRRNRISLQYPGLQCFADADELILHPELDAVVIATPIHTHYQLAKQALLAGKHVLVEKPLATSAAEVQELMELAAQKGLLLMVDHTFLYTGAVQKIKTLVEQGELGTLNYFDSTRINLGLFNPNWSVIWDLAVHDLSIFFYITGGKKPVSVSAVGQSHTAMGIEDLAYTTLFFEDGMMAHIASSWISPVKIRKTLIGGTRKMVIYDDVEPTEKIKIYDSGFTVRSPEELHRWLVDYRFGDIFIPKLEQKEALSGVAHDFIQCINTGETPLSNAQLGLQVVAVMEAAQESIRKQGAPVSLNL
jgi:predicted dehydrogenase